MSALPDDQVTFWLQKARSGDPQAQEELYRLVEAELRVRARSQLRGRRSPGLLQVTMLVDDAYQKLVVEAAGTLANRKEFYRCACTVMYNALVSHIRREKAGKRSNGKPLVTDPACLAQVPDRRFGAGEASDVDLRDDLEEWAKLDPQGSAIVNLLLLGHSADDIAEQLGIARATYWRRLKAARAWWHAKLHGEE